MDNTLQDLQNSSYPTKVEFNNCRFHSKCFRVLKGVLPFHSVFLLTKLNNTTLSPGIFGQRFNSLQRAALLTSF